MTKQSKIVVYRDASKRGDWRWSAIAENGRILADGAEGYQNKQDCLDGMQHAMDVLLGGLIVTKRKPVTRASLKGASK